MLDIVSDGGWTAAEIPNYSGCTISYESAEKQNDKWILVKRNKHTFSTNLYDSNGYPFSI